MHGRGKIENEKRTISQHIYLQTMDYKLLNYLCNVFKNGYNSFEC